MINLCYSNKFSFPLCSHLSHLLSLSYVCWWAWPPVFLLTSLITSTPAPHHPISLWSTKVCLRLFGCSRGSERQPCVTFGNLNLIFLCSRNPWNHSLIPLPQPVPASDCKIRSFHLTILCFNKTFKLIQVSSLCFCNFSLLPFTLTLWLMVFDFCKETVMFYGSTSKHTRHRNPENDKVIHSAGLFVSWPMHVSSVAWLDFSVNFRNA